MTCQAHTATILSASWSDPTTILTAVIAAATVAYVVCTIALWCTTKKAACAAMISAEAAKKSADIVAEMHRPFVGLSNVALQSGWGDRVWFIAFTLRNYGSLPALKVKADIQFSTDAQPRLTVTEPNSAEIFPLADLVSVCRFDMGDPDKVPVHNGSKALDIDVRITYEGPSGRLIRHVAWVHSRSGQFSVKVSKTLES
jgi:hypothetical protein